MTLNAAMSSLMTERFNVAGAYVAKIFGRRKMTSKNSRKKAGQVSAFGVKTADVTDRPSSATAIMVVTVVHILRIRLGRRAHRSAQA
jgi:hypothetical protein